MLRNSIGNILTQEFSFFTPIPELKGAACVDYWRPDDFFPEPGRYNNNNREARKLCKTCPVKEECLEFALVNNIKEGIWGGTINRQRALLRSQKGIAGVWP